MACFGEVNPKNIGTYRLCCFQLQTGIIILGALGVIGGVSHFLKGVFAFNINEHMNIDANIVLPIQVAYCLLALVGIAINALLILGVTQNKALYLFISLGENVAGLIFLLICIIVPLFLPIPWGIRFILALIFAGAFALGFYFMRAIYIYYLYLRYLEFERSYTPSIHAPGNPYYPTPMTV